MQKKNVLMMTMSLAMVGVVAVGGTLAYMTSTTKNVTNTFTVGSGYDDEGNDFLLNETPVSIVEGVTINPTAIETTVDDRVTTNTYAAVTPGSRIAKDPTFFLADDAPESWVVAKVTGVDNLVDTEDIIVSTTAAASVTDETTSVFDTNWKKVVNADGSVIGTTVRNDGKFDGYYIYTGSFEYTTVEKDGFASLEPLFTSVYVKSTVDDLASISAALEENDQIKVQGVAIQKDNTTEADAVSVAKTKLA